MDDNYAFELPVEFTHYVSSRDKTNVAPNTLIKGSKNVYKKRSGNWANRNGLKAYGPLNNTPGDGIASSFEFDTPFNGVIPLRVTKQGNLDFMYTIPGTTTPLWYNLLTGLTLQRWIFDSTYFDLVQYKQILLAANGGVNYIWSWEGGIATTVSATAPVGGVIYQGFNTGYSISSGGTGYVVGDILTIPGGSGTAQVPVTAVSGGVVTALGLLFPQGSGYSTGAVYTTGGTGTGFGIDILGVYAGGTITKTGSISFFESGFSKSYTTLSGGGLTPNTGQWYFKYNGNFYAYGGGLDTETLTGVTPDPTVIPAGSVIASPFIQVENVPFLQTPTNGDQGDPLNSFTCDMLKVINNQVYIASYSNPLIAVSDNTSYSNFTGNGGSSTNPNTTLSTAFFFSVPDLPVGITYQLNLTTNQQIPIVFHGNSSYDILNITTQTIPQGTAIALSILVAEQTTVTFADNAAPMSQEFIDQNGAYIVWLGQDHQLHTLGSTKDLFLSAKAPLLSQPVYDELKTINFSGGALSIIDDFVYITAPLIATHYLYQEREFVDESGTIRTEKVWNPPQISGISRFANINGEVYGHSNLYPMMYQIWDTNQWHDDGADGNPVAYQCVMAIAYNHLSGKGISRANMLKFDKVFYEGYIAAGTPLYASIYLDYQGSTAIVNQTINAPTQPGIVAKAVKLFSYLIAIALGQTSALGDNPLGNGLMPSQDNQDYIPKFRAIRKSPIKNIFEYSIEIWSYTEDARWEIITCGPNVRVSTEVPKELL